MNALKGYKNVKQEIQSIFKVMDHAICAEKYLQSVISLNPSTHFSQQSTNRYLRNDKVKKHKSQIILVQNHTCALDKTVLIWISKHFSLYYIRLLWLDGFFT